MTLKAISDFIVKSGSGCANITVTTAVYDVEAINHATYQYTGDYHILITPDGEGAITIIFEAKRDGLDVVGDMKNFGNDLIDQQVRLQLDRDNGKIRDLIVAHAFSPLDLKKEVASL